MPFYRKKRYFRKRKTFRKYARKGRSMPMRKWGGAELKFTDAASASTAQVLTGNGATNFYGALNCPIEGNDANGRNGRRVFYKSCSYRFYVTLAALNTNWDQFRMILVRDIQCNGLIFANTDLLTTTGNLGALVSPFNISNSRRFRILRDIQFTLNQNDHETICVKGFVKLGFTTEYNANNNGNVGDIQTNSLYWVLISNNNANGSFYNAITRLRFYDV